MAFGLSAGAIGLIGAGAGLVGGAMQAGAAGDAAELQAQGTRDANALQDKWMTRNDELQKPIYEAGNLARNKLLQLMGLGGGAGTSGGTSIDRNAIRQQLQASGKYNTPVNDPLAAWNSGQDDGRFAEGKQWVSLGDGSGGVWVAPNQTNTANLDADVEAQYQQQMQAQQGQQQQFANDPSTGSLLKSFGIEDYQEDPGYQFRLSEGLKGIDRASAGRGSFDSGATLKALGRFNSDQASQEYGNAFNRYNANQTNQFNRLSSLAGNGQQAANQVGNAGQQYANTVGNNLTNNANAQGAAGIAGANSWGNALSSGVNNYQQQNYMNSLLKNLGGTQSGGFNPGQTFAWGRE